MNGESNEFHGISENVLTSKNELKIMEIPENSSEINTYDCDKSQYNELQFMKLFSTNENNLQSPVHNDYYYNMTHADLLQRQQNDLINQQGIKSGETFGQEIEQIIFSSKNTEAPKELPKSSTHLTNCHASSQQAQEEISTQQQLSQHPVNEYSATVVTTVTSIFGSTSASVTSKPSLKRKLTSTYSTCAGPDNSNLTFGNDATTEFCGPDSVNTTVPLDNPEPRAMNFTNNRLSEAQYNLNMQQATMQTESINSVLAHQWHQCRKNLPKPLATTFCTELQTNNRDGVVNTAEIQKRKLQFLQEKAEKQLRRVNQQNENSTPSEQTKQQKDEQSQQQKQQLDHLYRLHQMQQQSHLRSLTPDSLSSSRQFTHSPISINSSTGSGHKPQQQTFPCILSDTSQQIQMQQTYLPNNYNAMDHLNSTATQQQQQLIMQALQQQYLQQLLIQQLYHPHYQRTTFSPDCFEKLQQLNQQRHHETLQENMTQHKSTHRSRRHSKKRKRPQEIIDNKENASVSFPDPALVIDQSAFAPSNVQLEDSKCDNDLKPKFANNKEQIKENIIVNLDDVKILSSGGKKSVKSDELSKDKLPHPSVLYPGGMWLNNYAMLQDWIGTQQQNINRNESDIIQ